MDGAVYCMHCSKRLVEKLSDEHNISQLSDVYYSYLNSNLNNGHTGGYGINQQDNYFIVSNEKTMFISMILAMLVPGFGLVYLKQVLLGLFVFLLTILLWIMTGILYYIFKIDIIYFAMSLSIFLYLASIIYTYKLVSCDNVERGR
ncbi:MAG: hypothetical protein BZ137_09015 [Methanosphaera sp. rholeuAM130]|nr:MAG: hypothetical protein BZ137_09015 [Methanosphaera sp. rholeuAM130]